MDYQPEPGLSPTARLRKLVSFLETGDAARASIELSAYEQDGGDPALAAYWHEQIHSDPGTIFEADGTVHTIRPGESLSSISQKFLGDPLRFYLLARFNEIENPSKIEAGQEIQIPKLRGNPPEPEPTLRVAAVPEVTPAGNDPAVEAAPADTGDASLETAPPAVAPPEPASPQSVEQPAQAPQAIGFLSSSPRPPAGSVPDTPPEAFDEAAERAGDGEMESAIVLLEDGLRRYPGNQKVRRAAVLAYTKHSEALISEGKPEQAAVTLAKAAELDPENQTIAERLQEVRNRIQAETFYQKGLGLRDGGDPEAALAAFGKALQIAPDYRDAQDQFQSLQSEVVDRMQRRAITALRQEDYPSALALWQEILAIDPTNGTADRYHKHTLELLSREGGIEPEAPASSD